MLHSTGSRLSVLSTNIPSYRIVTQPDYNSTDNSNEYYGAMKNVDNYHNSRQKSRTEVQTCISKSVKVY